MLIYKTNSDVKLCYDFKCYPSTWVMWHRKKDWGWHRSGVCNHETKSAKQRFEKRDFPYQANDMYKCFETELSLWGRVTEQPQLEHLLRGRKWQKMSLETQGGNGSRGTTVRNVDVHLRKSTQHFLAGKGTDMTSVVKNRCCYAGNSSRKS